MIFPKVHRIGVKTNEKKCCLCLGVTPNSCEPVFTEDGDIDSFSDFGKTFLIVLSMNKCILSRYCCKNCKKKVISTFNTLIELSVSAQIAIQKYNSKVDSEIKCSECDASILSSDELTKHFKEHIFNFSIKENTCQSRTTRSKSKLDSTNKSSKPQEENSLCFYDYCEVVKHESDAQSVSSFQSNKDDDSWKDDLSDDAEQNSSPSESDEEDIPLKSLHIYSETKSFEGKKKKKKVRMKVLKDEINDSIEKVDDGNGRSHYLCHECGKSYSSLPSLKCHLRNHDPNFKGYKRKRRSLGSRLCDVCGKSFTSGDTLRVHREKHDTLCPVCGKSIYKKYLQRHLSLHGSKPISREHRASALLDVTSSLDVTSTLDATPLNCAHCDKSYSDRFHLVNHMVLMHGGNFDRRQNRGTRRGLECSICGILLPSDPKLRRHKFEEHGITAEDRLQCEVCDRWYTGKMSLRKHIRAEHMNTAPHACKLCPKVFKRYQGLWAHMRTHDDLRPYECGVCQVRYRQRYEVVNHLGKHVRSGDVTLESAFARHLVKNPEKEKIEDSLIYLKDQKVKEVSELTILLSTAESDKNVALS